jgi:hypothetical protein
LTSLFLVRAPFFSILPGVFLPMVDRVFASRGSFAAGLIELSAHIPRGDRVGLKIDTLAATAEYYERSGCASMFSASGFVSRFPCWAAHTQSSHCCIRSSYYPIYGWAALLPFIRRFSQHHPSKSPMTIQRLELQPV